MMQPLTIMPNHMLATATTSVYSLGAGRGITYIHAGNGVFKHASNGTLNAIVQVSEHDVPGLMRLLPATFRWPAVGKVPGNMLADIVRDAQHAARESFMGVMTPIEKQYFIVWHEGDVRLYVPEQDAQASRIAYEMPQGAAVLVDVHSHHSMPAHFSDIDDRDDDGLSLSCVIGNLFQQPEICCRLNVYGHRQYIPASMIFDYCTLMEATVCKRFV